MQINSNSIIFKYRSKIAITSADNYLVNMVDKKEFSACNHYDYDMMQKITIYNMTNELITPIPCHPQKIKFP